MTDEAIGWAAANELSREMENESGVVYGLDSEFKITYCNKAWDQFALANGGSPRLLREFQVGRQLFDSIPDVLETFYRRGLELVLRTGIEWQHSYECSSAEIFRLHHMHVVRTHKPLGLVVVNSLAVSRRHEEAGITAETEVYLGKGGIVMMCSNCRRVRRNDREQWDWHPQLVREMPVEISHALCNSCWAIYYPEYGKQGDRGQAPGE